MFGTNYIKALQMKKILLKETNKGLSEEKNGKSRRERN